MDLAGEIKRLRSVAGLTQQQVADSLGVSRAYLGQLETGVRVGLAAETLFKLSRVLGVGCDHWREFFDPNDTPAVEPPAPKPRGRPRKPGPAGEVEKSSGGRATGPGKKRV